jgi:hypothetical protein
MASLDGVRVIAVSRCRRDTSSPRPSGKLPLILGADSLDALDVKCDFLCLPYALTQDVSPMRRKQSFASGTQEVQTEVSEVVS